jgi:hypothetical protein
MFQIRITEFYFVRTEHVVTKIIHKHTSNKNLSKMLLIDPTSLSAL